MHSIDEYADDSLHNYDRNSVAPNTEPRSSTPATRGVVQTPASRGESRKEQERKDNEVVSILCAFVSFKSTHFVLNLFKN